MIGGRSLISCSQFRDPLLERFQAVRDEFADAACGSLGSPVIWASEAQRDGLTARSEDLGPGRLWAIRGRSAVADNDQRRPSRRSEPLP
jgi:hypothetical protein